MKSIPVAAKVGSAGVLGVGGIAGTGLLIHDRIQKSNIRQEQENEAIYKLKALDKELIKDRNASIVFSTETNKGDFAPVGGNKKAISITIVASSEEQGNKFKKDIKPSKWTCVVKGFVKDKDLNLENDSKNFDKVSQKSLFQPKLDQKEGFVKSCARNRTGDPSSDSESLTSEVKFELVLGSENDANKYVFSSDFINKLFSGNWVNHPESE